MPKLIADIEKEALENIERSESVEALELVSTRYLGRKGELTGFLRNISSLPETERPDAGKNANLLKVKLESLIRQAASALEAGAENKGGGLM